jgi:hypothetical protein
LGYKGHFTRQPFDLTLNSDRMIEIEKKKIKRWIY